MSNDDKMKNFSKFEDNISSKWLLWLGAITMALGGVFLVKYSIEANIIPPIFRVISGTVFGFGLVITGEMVRRKRLDIEWWQSRPDYFPSAVSASGIFIMFASIFSAYGLYDLISQEIAYVILGFVALGASYLAFYQGRFFAYLGLIGGMLIPALLALTLDMSLYDIPDLILGNNQNEWALFPYLMIIIAAGLWIGNKNNWIDVIVTALYLALCWIFFWVGFQNSEYDILPIGLLVITIGALSSFFFKGRCEFRKTGTTIKSLIPNHPITLVSDIVIIACYSTLYFLIKLDDYSFTSLTLFGLSAATHVIALLRNSEYDFGSIMSVLSTLGLIITWKETGITNDGFVKATIHSNEMIMVAMISSIVTGASIFINLKKLVRKNMWAVIGVAFPIINMAYTYWIANEGEPNLVFAATATILAGFFSFAALIVLNEKEKYSKEILASYASGATMALSLGLSFILKDAWLTFSLAIQIVALGIIWKKIQVHELRKLAYGLAVVVIARLFFNPAIFEYDMLHGLGIFNWLFYGYGLTSVLFAYAARLFKTEGLSNQLEVLLKAGSALLAVSFTTLEIHVIFSENGGLLSNPTAFEMAVQTANWSIVTTFLYWLEYKNGNQLIKILRKIMMALSIAGLLFGGGIFNFVFNNGVDIGPYIIFNVQLIQFLLPALLYGFKAYLANEMNKKTAYLYAGIAFGIIWYWMTAEVYHVFHPFGTDTSISNLEWYCYSAVWLVYSVVIIIFGMRMDSITIRKVGLAILAIVILKVFLYDMKHLEGILRALSFMGLGGTMIGIGFGYQRLMSKE